MRCTVDERVSPVAYIRLVSLPGLFGGEPGPLRLAIALGAPRWHHHRLRIKRRTKLCEFSELQSCGLGWVGTGLYTSFLFFRQRDEISCFLSNQREGS